MTISKRIPGSSLVAVSLFILVFVWILFLTQGLPIGDPDDWDHVLVAQDLPWPLLLKKAVTPWSASHLWTGQVDRINEMTNRRLGLTIVLKTIISLFGLRSFPLYIFSEAVFFAGTVTLLFLLLRNITKSVLWALPGTIFFAFVPAHYPHVLWITDPITIVHCLMLAGLVAYLKLAKNLDRDGSRKDFFKIFLVFFIVSWFAIKTKEPALIFPLSIGAYALFQIPKWRTRKLKLAVLFGSLALMVFQIIPLGAPSKISPHAFTFRPHHIMRMVLRNYEAGYDNEATSAFFSLEQLWPVSIARTLGFFLLWTVVLLAALYLYQRIMSRKADRKSLFFGHPLAVISIFWLIGEIFFMGLFQADPRYFSGTLIPITILVTRLTHCVSQLYPVLLRRFIILIAIFSVGWATFYSNFSHVIYLRRLVGQRSNRFLNIGSLIYKDKYPTRPQDLRSIAFFYCAAYEPESVETPRMRQVSYFIDMGYDAWNKALDGSPEKLPEHAANGASYYVTFDPQKLEGIPNISEVAVISGINEQSVFERILYSTRKKPAPLRIFNYQTAP